MLWGCSSLFIVVSLLTTGDVWAAEQCGEAAWYPSGGITASGEPNAAGALTAAHPRLPFGTKVSVRNLANGKSVVLRINDRGPFRGKRIIDVSRAAAERLGFIANGVTRVRVTVLGDLDVKLPGACKSADAGPAGEGADVATAGPDKPVADDVVIAQPVSEQAMSARFSLAFQPDSWTEAELRKALEAFLPALRP